MMTTEDEKQILATRILLIDDDEKFCRLIADYLAPMGFALEAAHNGIEGLRLALEGDYQAVILDYMLPGLDGLEVLRQLRKTSSIPVLMLTALGDESDRIVGLEVGADDYLPKTFSPRELLARLRAVTRRSVMTRQQLKAEQEGESIGLRGLEVFPSARRANLDGNRLSLTAIEFDLLLCLVRAQDRVLTRDQLLDDISGRNYEVFDRSIDVHISSLRKKLNDDPRRPRFIKTIRSVGYVLLSLPEETES